MINRNERARGAVAAAAPARSLLCWHWKTSRVTMVDDSMMRCKITCHHAYSTARRVYVCARNYFQIPRLFQRWLGILATPRLSKWHPALLIWFWGDVPLLLLCALQAGCTTTFDALLSNFCKILHNILPVLFSVSTAVLRAYRVPACKTHRSVRMSRALAA